MAAEQAHVRADGPLRYTGVSPSLFLPGWMDAMDDSPPLPLSLTFYPIATYLSV